MICCILHVSCADVLCVTSGLLSSLHAGFTLCYALFVSCALGMVGGSVLVAGNTEGA